MAKRDLDKEAVAALIRSDLCFSVGRAGHEYFGRTGCVVWGMKAPLATSWVPAVLDGDGQSITWIRLTDIMPNALSCDYDWRRRKGWLL